MGPTLLQVFSDLDKWQLLAVIVKAGTYGATFAAAGGIIFISLFRTKISEQQCHAILRFIMKMATVSMVLSVLRIGTINVMLSGDLSGMFEVAMTRMVLQSSEGIATGLRLVGLLFIAVLAHTSMRRLRISIAFAAAIVAATSFAWVGHAGEVEVKLGPESLPQFLLCLHLLAVTFWLGALWPLHHLTYDNDLEQSADITYRFGKLAAVIVCLLIVAGALLSSVIIGRIDALWGSSYGQLFMIKLGWVILLLGIAAINKLHLTPRLLRGDQSAIEKLRLSIKVEMVLASLILFTTAFFTSIVGPVGLE